MKIINVFWKENVNKLVKMADDCRDFVFYGISFLNSKWAIGIMKMNNKKTK